MNKLVKGLWGDVKDNFCVEELEEWVFNKVVFIIAIVFLWEKLS